MLDEKLFRELQNDPGNEKKFQQMFLGDIHSDISKTDLRNYFSELGEVSELEIYKGKPPSK